MENQTTILIVANKEADLSHLRSELAENITKAVLLTANCRETLLASLSSPIDVAVVCDDVSWASPHLIINQIKETIAAPVIFLARDAASVALVDQSLQSIDDFALLDAGRSGLLSIRVKKALNRKSASEPSSNFLALAVLTEQALSGLFLLDHDCRFIYANPAFLTATGYSQSDLISHRLPFLDLCSPSDRVRVENQLTQLANHEIETFRDTITWQNKDGSFFEGDITAARKISLGQNIIAGSMLQTTVFHAREREISAVLAMLATLRSHANRHDTTATLLNEVMSRLNLQAAAIALRHPSNSEITFEMGLGTWSHWTGERVRLWEGITGLVISTSKPYFSDQSEPSHPVIDPKMLEQTGFAACVPLSVQLQPIGVLWVGSSTPFSPDDRLLLSAIAEAAATTIHQAVLNERTERQVQRLTALRAIDMAINSSLDVRVTLDILVGQVTTQLGIDAADVLLLSPFSQTLELVASRGFRTSPAQRYQAESGIFPGNRAAVERRTISIPDLRTSSDLNTASKWAGEDFIACYAVPLIAKGQVKGVLELWHRQTIDPDPEWMDFLQTVTAQAAIAIDNAELFDKLQRSNTDLMMAYDATIEGWSHALELRDSETQGHTLRVAELTIELAKAMHMPDEELVHIRRGVLLHDIGKMAIPDHILRKKGPLDEQEWKVMRMHANYAYDLLYPILYLRPAIDIPYAHHERWDGTGYPRGLKGEQIPLAARIFSVVDVWDALHSNRHYRKAWSKEKAMEHIRSHAGTQFDPHVVEVFLKIIS